MMKQSAFFLLAVLILSSCKQAPEPAPEMGILPVDFQVFYELFHRDSTYQMDHIHFPLEGLPDYADSQAITTGEYRWEKEDWVMHRQQLANDPDFQRELSMFGDFVVRERYVHKERPLLTERRFAKEGDEWYLIYYAGLNTYRRQ